MLVPPKWLYKVLSHENWKGSTEFLLTSPDDSAFIHLSTEEQLDRVIAKFFAKVDVHGVSPHEEHFRGIRFRDLEGVNSSSAINDDQSAEAGPLKCSTRWTRPR